MLAHRLRFHRRNTINYIRKNGKSVRGDKLSLKHIANSQENSRIAVVVSKKVDKRAVARNRIRRRVYEALRLEWDSIVTGQDIVITIFDSSLASVPAVELRQSLFELLEKAELIHTSAQNQE